MSASPRRYDLLRTRLDRFVRMLPGVESGDVRAVHRTRVASRRLRELLPILQLDSETSDKLGRRLRDVTRRLGSLRELDVLLLVIDGLHESGRHDRRALRRVADEVRLARAAALEKVTGRGLPAELHRVGRKLERVAKRLEADKDIQPRGRGWRWALDARVVNRSSILLKAIDHAGAVYLPERLHRVRIALKKFRYAVELSSDTTASIDAADLKTLKRDQELLGRLHDLQVLLDRVRNVQATPPPPDLAAGRELTALVVSLENACRRLHARYVRERTALAAICDRVGARSEAPALPAARRAG